MKYFYNTVREGKINTDPFAILGNLKKIVPFPGIGNFLDTIGSRTTQGAIAQ